MTRDEQRERDRVRQARRRRHLRGDHAICRKDCHLPYKSPDVGGIMKASDCKAKSAAFEQPSTITLEEYRRREVSGLQHVSAFDAVELVHHGAIPDFTIGGRWAS